MVTLHPFNLMRLNNLPLEPVARPLKDDLPAQFQILLQHQVSSVPKPSKNAVLRIVGNMPAKEPLRPSLDVRLKTVKSLRSKCSENPETPNPTSISNVVSMSSLRLLTVCIIRMLSRQWNWCGMRVNTAGQRLWNGVEVEICSPSFNPDTWANSRGIVVSNNSSGELRICIQWALRIEISSRRICC